MVMESPRPRGPWVLTLQASVPLATCRWRPSAVSLLSASQFAGVVHSKILMAGSFHEFLSKRNLRF